MAELKGNGLWDNIESGGNDALDRVLGPSFDYTAAIKTPSQLGVGTSGDVGQLITNSFAVGNYVGELTLGPGTPYGNQTYVETGGMCRAPGGGVIPRWSYINNKLGGEDALPASLKRSIGTGTFEGIIPGMFGDITSLNPLKLINALYLDGIPDCRAVTCPVTDVNGNARGPQTQFMVPEFEQNLGKCRAAPSSVESALEASEVAAVKARYEKSSKTFETSSETFSPYFAGTPRPMLVRTTDLTPYVLWGAAVLTLMFFVGKKL